MSELAATFSERAAGATHGAAEPGPVTIRVQGLGKRYRLGQIQLSNNLRETLTEAVKRPLRRLAARRDREGERADRARLASDRTLWALEDIDLEVRQGEVLGIVGKNGAGKSTLLKLLSRITEPTAGRIELAGRVASLLEVGTGFHPELTGRENIYLNGTILGMRKREVDRNFDRIVAFAEVERFLDTPVKRYSSGMYVRLAFAVAAHLEPEILLVDEVLAVGDAAFQRRCLGKIDDIAGEGRTVLFVSHNMAAVQRLCSRAVLLEGGRLVASGTPGAVVARYLAEEERPAYRAPEAAFTGGGKPRLLEARLERPDGAPLARPNCAEPFVVALTYRLPEDAPGTRLGIGVLSSELIPLFTHNTGDAGLTVPHRAGVYRAAVAVPADSLLAGDYHLAVCLWNEREILDLVEPALSLSVDPGASELYLAQGQRKGYVHLPCRWTIEPTGGSLGERGPEED